MSNLRKSPFDNAGQVTGNLPIPAGVIEQSAFHGEFVAAGVTPVNIAFPQVTRNMIISFTLNTVGGTVGNIPTVKTITPNTGFSVAATASDTSRYNWAVTHILN